MKRNLILAGAASLLCFTGARAEESYWQQDVRYEMNVTLLPQEQALAGDELIVYHNNSPDTLYKFYLHLYPNAYKNSESIHAKEARKFYKDIVPQPEKGGHIRIDAFRITSGQGNVDAPPVTAFEVEDTILRADLPEPLAPGDSMHIRLKFYHKVRDFSRRAGYRNHQYDFAQWYPKVCVYDETGWNARPFHYLGEFYGEFGTFDVTITAPSEYIIGATGVVTAGDPGWSLVQVDTSLSDHEWQKRWRQIRTRFQQQARNGTSRTVTFHADNVHDFAWVASPDFLYERGEWDGIPLHVLYRSHAKPEWSKVVLQRGARALAWLSEKFGRYPYPQVTIAHGLLSGGMEYPMLAMNYSARESLILHEIGHIYFFGILGNNEWKEAWLDEGFTTFQTRWYLETRYGKWGFDYDAWRQKATWLQRQRPRATRRQEDRQEALAYMHSGHNEPIAKISHKFKDHTAYNRNAYTKGAFFFDMLRYVVGDSLFEEICHEYFDRWKFKHVNEARFKRVCEDVSGIELDWFFKQWLHDSVTVDYALANVMKQKKDGRWHTRVDIIRKERGTMPLEIQLTTRTGDTVVQRWNGFAEIGEVTFVTRDEPEEVVLDPRDAILDNSRFNNGPVGAEFLFEYPNLDYTPRDAYLITWRPSGWYNKVDKLRLGGRVIAREGTETELLLGGWYGTDSKQLDGLLRYTKNIRSLGAGTQGTLLAQKMEGRLEVDARLTFVTSTSITSLPKHRFGIGINHSQLVGDNPGAYTKRRFDQEEDAVLQTWQAGDVNKLYAWYSANPRGMNWFLDFTFGAETAQSDWGSDFQYTTGYSEVKFWLPRRHEGVFLRLYGQATEGTLPIQDQLFLDGANSRKRFQRFYLRSDGALPTWLHYHLPGGGNVRGYLNNPKIDDGIVAFNMEIRKRIIVDKLLKDILGKKTAVLFFDAATLSIFDVHILADAGVGLRFHHILPDKWFTLFTGGRKLTLRLDFPLWVSDPLPEENPFSFRWLFGFEQTF